MISVTSMMPLPSISPTANFSTCSFVGSVVGSVVGFTVGSSVGVVVGAVVGSADEAAFTSFALLSVTSLFST